MRTTTIAASSIVLAGVLLASACTPAVEDTGLVEPPTPTVSPTPTRTLEPLIVPAVTDGEVGRFVFTRPEGLPQSAYTLSDTMTYGTSYALTAECTAARGASVTYEITTTDGESRTVVGGTFSCDAPYRAQFDSSVDGGVQISMGDLTDVSEAYAILRPVT